MIKKTTVETGRLGEAIAAKFLKKSGFKILERNRHQSHNELDLIAVNKEFLVFCEVKTRSVEKDLYSPYGTPASSVTRGKQMRTIKAAQAYLTQTKHNEKQPRFDVIEIFLDKETHKLLKLNHIPNAFGIK